MTNQVACLHGIPEGMSCFECAKPSRGIVYVTWGVDAQNEAIVSIRNSIKRYPTCIITDEAMTDLTEFDIVKIVDLSGYRQIFRKWAAYLHTPFDVTMLLDTDCFVVNEMDMAFEIIEERPQYVVAHSPHMTFRIDGKEYSHYQGGMQLFPREMGQQLLDAFSTQKPVVPTSFGYLSEEGPIALALRAGIVPFTTLPPSFHVCRKGQTPTRPIRVLHSRSCGPPPSLLMSDADGGDFVVRGTATDKFHPPQMAP